MSSKIGKRETEAMNIPVPGTDLEPADPERLKRMATEIDEIRAAMMTLGRSVAVVMEDFNALNRVIMGDRVGITHACPPGMTGIMPCCGRGPMDVPLTERIVTDQNAVTCRGALA